LIDQNGDELEVCWTDLGEIVIFNKFGEQVFIDGEIPDEFKPPMTEELRLQIEQNLANLEAQKQQNEAQNLEQSASKPLSPIKPHMVESQIHQIPEPEMQNIIPPSETQESQQTENVTETAGTETNQNSDTEESGDEEFDEELMIQKEMERIKKEQERKKQELEQKRKEIERKQRELMEEEARIQKQMEEEAKIRLETIKQKALARLR
jgi:hypothetical protein